MGTSVTRPPSMILRGKKIARFWFGVKLCLGVLWFIRPDGPKKENRWDVNQVVKVPLLRERALHLEIGPCAKLQVCTMQCWYDKQKMVKHLKMVQGRHVLLLGLYKMFNSSTRRGLEEERYDRWASPICSKTNHIIIYVHIQARIPFDLKNEWHKQPPPRKYVDTKVARFVACCNFASISPCCKTAEGELQVVRAIQHAKTTLEHA